MLTRWNVFHSHYFPCNVSTALPAFRTSFNCYCLRHRLLCHPIFGYVINCGRWLSLALASRGPLFVGNVIRCCSNVSLLWLCWPQLIRIQHVAVAGWPSHDLISLILSGCRGTVLRYCCYTVRGIHRCVCCCMWFAFELGNCICVKIFFKNH